MVKRSYRTDEIVVHWNSELCIHTAICLNALPHVFNVQAIPVGDIEGIRAGELIDGNRRRGLS